MRHSKPNVIIVGGGVAGMAAANALDQSGIGVHLIEKHSRLGGNAFDWACMATDNCRNCGACLVAELVAQVQDRPGIRIHINSSLSNLEKNGSNFQASLTAQYREPVRADAVLFSTGFVPFNPSQIPELGYGLYDNVITTADLNAILKQEALPASLPDTPSPAIAFIQCVGSRNRKLGRDYCSQVCCKTTVRQADKILHLIPDARITLFHIDLQIIGKAFRTHAAEVAARVNLRQGVPAKILNHLQPGQLSIVHEDGETGARTAAHFDLVVLAVGMEPPAETRDLAHQLGIPTDGWGFMARGDQPLAPGIYAAGASQGPMDILSAREQGIAAAQRIAADLGFGTPYHDPQGERPTIAVLGGTAEAFAAADMLSQERYSVVLLDPDSQTPPGDNGISYHPQARLTRMGGTVGDYELSFMVGQDIQTVKAAGIVVATGAAKAAVHESSDAIQNLTDFTRDFENDPNALPDTIVFWLDSRGPENKGNGRRCLELAHTLRLHGKTVIVVMEKMLVHGLTGQQLYDQARHAGVRFLRVSDPSRVQVTASGNGAILTVNEATLPVTPITVECRRLVVPEQIRPLEVTGSIAHTLGQALDAEGFFQSVNVRHLPVASPRRGIFFVGPCHDEVDQEDIAAEFRAVKAALAMLTMVLKGDPSGDLVAEIDEGLCARCLTCLRACPHEAVVLSDGYQPRIAAQACFGCGICVSSCPARAIAAKSQDPAVQNTTARTVVFACERSAGLAAKAAGLAPAGAGNTLDIRTVPCTGRLDQLALVQPLIDGAQTVIVAGCHEGNCRSMIGSKIAATRVRQLAATEIDPSTAVSYHAIAANEPQKLVLILRESGRQKEEPHV